MTYEFPLGDKHMDLGMLHFKGVDASYTNVFMAKKIVSHVCQLFKGNVQKMQKLIMDYVSHNTMMVR